MLRLPLTLLLLTVVNGQPEEPEPVGFPVLAGFDYKEGMTLPKEVTELDEKEVRIRGFMRREFPGSGPVNSFMLINDACGCNGTPMMNEIVFCTLPEDEEIDMKTGVVTVTGKLYVGEEKEDGDVILIYAMDADTVTTTSSSATANFGAGDSATGSSTASSRVVTDTTMNEVLAK